MPAFAEPAAAVQQFGCRNVCKKSQRGHVPNLSMVPSNLCDIAINLRRMEQLLDQPHLDVIGGNQIGARSTKSEKVPNAIGGIHVHEFAANECCITCSFQRTIASKRIAADGSACSLQQQALRAGRT